MTPSEKLFRMQAVFLEAARLLSNQKDGVSLKLLQKGTDKHVATVWRNRKDPTGYTVRTYT